jgi:hypothetical protein
MMLQDHIHLTAHAQRHSTFLTSSDIKHESVSLITRCAHTDFLMLEVSGADQDLIQSSVQQRGHRHHLDATPSPWTVFTSQDRFRCIISC